MFDRDTIISAATETVNFVRALWSFLDFGGKLRISKSSLIREHPEFFTDIDGAKGTIGEAKFEGNYLSKNEELDALVDQIMKDFAPYLKVPQSLEEDEVAPTSESVVDVSTQIPTEQQKTVHEVNGDISNNFATAFPSSDSAVIDLGTGIKFNPDEINQAFAMQDAMNHPQQPAYDPAALYAQTVAMYQQFMSNPQTPMQGIHKVDEAPKPPKVIAPEDRVNYDLAGVNFNGLTVPPVVKQPPEYIESIPKGEAQPIQAVENRANNSAIFAKYPKLPLKQIEQIANANQCSITMKEGPEGIILVVTTDYVGGSGCNLEKTFFIDTGMIIDNRAKLFATNSLISDKPLEFAPVYELLVADPKNDGKRGLDTKLINDIFYAGFKNISKREMYTEDYKRLNSKVALITLPTRGLNKEQRHSIQDFLLKIDKEGFFDQALQVDPDSRFVFAESQLNKKNLGNFTLINHGVPKLYGSKKMAKIPMTIEVRNGKVTLSKK